ncbi:glycosyltransferase family 1 protein [Phormidium sp. CLA17]|uniref:glycosyltransferase n=1 Tax=Leptolyngbya sp. Cla-17 TaxID=2803751 RepID=UPI001490F126|nr:glycosyltransferase [Leptolyngbya sp. Cla-17]MBM0740903.1 glycosyltransferase family 1 protein [Leptolyngbya sp. Cla-17]
MNTYLTFDALPYPVYFVRNDAALCEQFQTITEMPPFADYYRPEWGGSSSWIVQTYLQLKLRGLDVHLVDHFIPNCICVVSREELMQRSLWQSLPYSSYLVVCQQDRPRPEICAHRIVQNPLNILTSTDHLMQFWVQPELRSRNPERGTQVSTLAFKGRWYYLPEAFKNSEFVSQLSSQGFTFTTLPDYEVSLSDWSEFSETDVVLAIRYSNREYLESKPASKLINAWFAGCPALLGPEPAYQALRKSSLDYIEVHNPDDVTAALQNLRNNPDLYQAMVENGWKRSQEFTPDQISLNWRNLLAGSISTGYTQWQKRSLLWKLTGRPLQFGYRMIQQETERRRFNRVTGRKR